MTQERDRFLVEVEPNVFAQGYNASNVHEIEAIS
jgi:hypothetical protein